MEINPEGLSPEELARLREAAKRASVPKPDDHLMNVLAAVQWHAETSGKDVTERFWRLMKREVREAHRERQNLLMAYEELQELRGHRERSNR